MSDPNEEAKRIIQSLAAVVARFGALAEPVSTQVVAATLAARDEELAGLRAALDSVSFPDRRWK